MSWGLHTHLPAWREGTAEGLPRCLQTLPGTGVRADCTRTLLGVGEGAVPRVLQGCLPAGRMVLRVAAAPVGHERAACCNLICANIEACVRKQAQAGAEPSEGFPGLLTPSTCSA